MSIRLGLALPVQKTFSIGRDIPAVAKAAEQIGYDSLWAGERVLVPESPAGVVPFERRGAALDETLDICAAVWGPDPVSRPGTQGTLSAIAPSEVGPKPARPIPVLLAGSTPATFGRIVDRADGWIPVATDPAFLAEQWKQLQALAAERGRRRPIGISLVTAVGITPGPADEGSRQPFQGSLEQVTRDAIRFTRSVPITDLAMSLSGSLTNVGQLVDTVGTLHASLRAAGL